jgi:hypothetical protein
MNEARVMNEVLNSKGIVGPYQPCMFEGHVVLPYPQA